MSAAFLSSELLRKMEEEEVAEGRKGFFEAEVAKTSHAHGHHFINEGKVDGYRSILTAQQIDAAAVRFKPIMDQLDYAP